MILKKLRKQIGAELQERGVSTGMKLFPPQNPATVRVTLKRNGNSQTEISFSSDSFDGGVGFGSAGKAISQIIKVLEKTL